MSLIQIIGNNYSHQPFLLSPAPMSAHRLSPLDINSPRITPSFFFPQSSPAVSFSLYFPPIRSPFQCAQIQVKIALKLSGFIPFPIAPKIPSNSVTSAHLEPISLLPEGFHPAPFTRPYLEHYSFKNSPFLEF